MYLGSRNTGEGRLDEEMFRVLGKYADAISINYYDSWTPDTKLLAMWERESGKPEIITEWYVKGADSGMPNTTRSLRLSCMLSMPKSGNGLPT